MLIAVHNYPLPSETYIETERRFLERVADTHVLARAGAGDAQTPEHGTFTVAESARDVRRLLRRWRPDVVHAHWATSVEWAAEIARSIDVPWTVRTHSFDVLTRPMERLRRVADLANGSDCLGVLGFPFARARLEAAGLRPNRFVAALPVADVARFRAVGPSTGESVLSFGALQERKAVAAGDFARLSRLVPERRFVHHPLGHGSHVELRTRLDDIVAGAGGRVEGRDWVPHSRMPAVWADARWFVYPGPEEMGFGWPVGIAEAWAAGVGVCVRRVRPDIEEYVGDAAIVFDDLVELRDRLAGEPDAVMLDRGRARAETMDVGAHGARLLDRWAAAGLVTSPDSGRGATA